MDADDFEINATTGVTFKVAPDYETKSFYQVSVKAFDGLLSKSSTKCNNLRCR